MCDMSVLMGFDCRAIFSLLQNGFILINSATRLQKKTNPLSNSFDMEGIQFTIRILVSGEGTSS